MVHSDGLESLDVLARDVGLGPTEVSSMMQESVEGTKTTDYDDNNNSQEVVLTLYLEISILELVVPKISILYSTKYIQIN